MNSTYSNSLSLRHFLILILDTESFLKYPKNAYSRGLNHVICKYYPLISAQKPGNMFFQSYPILNRKSEKGSFRSGISEISSKMDHFEISGHLRVVAAAEVIYQVFC